MDDGGSDEAEGKFPYVVSFDQPEALENFKRYSRDNGIEIIREFSLTNSISVSSDEPEINSLKEIFPDGSFSEDAPGELED